VCVMRFQQAVGCAVLCTGRVHVASRSLVHSRELRLLGHSSRMAQIKLHLEQGTTGCWNYHQQSPGGITRPRVACWLACSSTSTVREKTSQVPALYTQQTQVLLHCNRPTITGWRFPGPFWRLHRAFRMDAVEASSSLVLVLIHICEHLANAASTTSQSVLKVSATLQLINRPSFL